MAVTTARVKNRRIMQALLETKLAGLYHTPRARLLRGRKVGLDDFLDLIHRFYDGGADLLTFVGGQRREQAVRFRGAAAETDRQVIGPRIVQEALTRNLHA